MKLHFPWTRYLLGLQSAQIFHDLCHFISLLIQDLSLSLGRGWILIHWALRIPYPIWILLMSYWGLSQVSYHAKNETKVFDLSILTRVANFLCCWECLQVMISRALLSRWGYNTGEMTFRRSPSCHSCLCMSNWLLGHLWSLEQNNRWIPHPSCTQGQVENPHALPISSLQKGFHSSLLWIAASGECPYLMCLWPVWTFCRKFWCWFHRQNASIANNPLPCHFSTPYNILLSTL